MTVMFITFKLKYLRNTSMINLMEFHKIEFSCTHVYICINYTNHTKFPLNLWMM